MSVISPGAGQPIDAGYLAEIGLSNLPEPLKADLLEYISQTLRMRVGAAIVASLDAEDLAEFQRLSADGSEGTSVEWLNAHVPLYKEIVAHEIDSLKADVVKSVPAIAAHHAVTLGWDQSV